MAVDFDRLKKVNELASTLKAQGIAPSMDDALKMAEGMVSGSTNIPEKPKPSARVPSIHELAEKKRRITSDIREGDTEIIGGKTSIGSALEGGSTSIKDLIEQVRQDTTKTHEPEIIGAEDEFNKNEEIAAVEVAEEIDSEEIEVESEEEENEIEVKDEVSEIVEYSEPEEEKVEGMEISEASEEDVEKIHSKPEVEVPEVKEVSQDLDTFSKEDIDNDVDFEKVPESESKEDDFDDFEDESTDVKEDPEKDYEFVASDREDEEVQPEIVEEPETDDLSDESKPEETQEESDYEQTYEATPKAEEKPEVEVYEQ